MPMKCLHHNTACVCAVKGVSIQLGYNNRSDPPKCQRKVYSLFRVDQPVLKKERRKLGIFDDVLTKERRCNRCKIRVRSSQS
jgi:hypothetical protein